MSRDLSGLYCTRKLDNLNADVGDFFYYRHVATNSMGCSP